MKTPNFATKTPEKVHKPTGQRANKSPIQNPENLDNSSIRKIENFDKSMEQTKQDKTPI